jgi:heptose-I-phosphate ethanolaminephosphotransferase
MVLGAVVLVLAILAGWQASRPLLLYRELAAQRSRLPALPALHAATRGRDPGFPVKVWVHRVDSIERAVLMARKFAGMEIDVVFDSAAGYFDVGHPPLPSAGISLDSLLAAIPDVGSHYFWIDFKNLTDANAPEACRVLLAMARKHGIVGHMIVESSNPRALSCFTAGGFYTSYYLFPDEGLASMDASRVTRYYEEVKSNLAASDVNAVSSSYVSLPFIEAYLPDADVLLWYLVHENDPGSRAALAYLERKSEVKVILVRRLSRGYR